MFCLHLSHKHVTVSPKQCLLNWSLICFGVCFCDCACVYCISICDCFNWTTSSYLFIKMYLNLYFKCICISHVFVTQLFHPHIITFLCAFVFVIVYQMYLSEFSLEAWAFLPWGKIHTKLLKTIQLFHLQKLFLSVHSDAHSIIIWLSPFRSNWQKSTFHSFMQKF